jgi:hypothetical protein
LPAEHPSRTAAHALPPKKAVEILMRLVNDAPELESEPFVSPKREQWTNTAQGALDRAFTDDSSILMSFGAAQAVSLGPDESAETLRQMANRTLSSQVAVLRSAIEQLSWQIGGEEHAGELKGATESGLMIFISHNSKDAELALAVIELLKGGLGLRSDQIRCSSVDGYRLPVGANTEAKLREEVRAAKVMIGLITPSSLSSSYVMFELGARWGAELFLAPLLAGVRPQELSGPLSLLNALSSSNEAQLHQLLDDVSKQLDLPLQSAASYVRNIAQVKQLSAGVAPAAPIRPGRDFRIALKVEGLAPSQVLRVTAVQPVCISRLEYMLADETCIVGEDLSLEGEALEVPLNYGCLTKLFNTPRPDRNSFDGSGPAKLALTVSSSGTTGQLVLPVRLETSIQGSTHYCKIIGSKDFYRIG